MADNYSDRLSENTWKVNLSTNFEPKLALASARELLRGELTLKHDIFIWNGNVYKEEGKCSPDSFENFFKYEIDISPAKFNPLSLPGELKDNKSINDLIGSPKSILGISFTGNFNCWDRDAAIYPGSKKETWNYEEKSEKSSWAKYFRPNSELNKNVLGPTGFSPEDMLKVIHGETSYPIPDSEIFLYTEDSVISSSISSLENAKCYINIKINPNSLKIKKLLYGAIILNSSESIDYDYLPNLKDVDESDLLDLSTLINNTTNNDDYKSPEEDPLNYLYFWVTAPIAADYVKPSDFNQNLNQESNVTHANMLISDKTNDTRYDDKEDPGTRAYLPQNSPLKDLLEDKYMGYANSDQGESNIEKILNYRKDPNNRLGKTLSIYGRTTGNEKENQYVAPITYFDPESRETASYYTGLGRIPTIIGKNGNITTDGRIMSPTIDELWYVIKKLISGQKVSYKANKEQLGEPHNDSNQIDTTLTEAISAQYNYNYKDGTPFKADPIKMSFNKGNSGYQLKIDEWVTQPEKTTLYSYKNETDISNKITSFYKKNTNDSTDRDIDSIFNASKAEGEIFSEVNKDQTYGPRSSAPLSLRELEAAILGNKANIDLNTLFNSKTYAVTGLFGKRDTELDQITSGGSLYQLHRDYNAEVDKPNTWFKQNGQKDFETGFDAEFGDTKAKGEDREKIILDKDNTPKVGVTHNSAMPLMVNKYGTSALLKEEQSEYTGAEVFLAADGTWRRINEHVRIPVLRSRY